VSEHPPAVITATFEATFVADAYQQLMDTLPLQADIVGGPLDGAQVTFQPNAVAPETLVVQVGAVQHWHRRVECDWWTCYEWIRDFERERHDEEDP
jgi:hypothetical protein